MDAKEEWTMRRENLELKRMLIETQVEHHKLAHMEITRQIAAMGEEYTPEDGKVVNIGS